MAVNDLVPTKPPVECGLSRRRGSWQPRNAQSSTGPRSEAGRQRSAQNALLHGVYAQTGLAIPRGPFAEDPGALEEQRAAIVASLHPRDAIEERQARTVATLYVKLDRLDRLEAHGIDRDTDHARINELHHHAEEADVEAARARSLYEALTGTPDDYDWQGFTSTVLDIANGGIPVAVEGLWTTERTPADDDEWRAVAYARLEHFYPDLDAAAAAIMNYSLRNAHEAAQTQARCLAIAAQRVLSGTLPKAVPIAARLGRQLDQALHTYRTLTEREVPVDSSHEDGHTSTMPFSRNEPNP